MSIIPNYRNFYKVGDTQFAAPSSPIFEKILRWSFDFSRRFSQAPMLHFPLWDTQFPEVFLQ